MADHEHEWDLATTQPVWLTGTHHHRCLVDGCRIVNNDTGNPDPDDEFLEDLDDEPDQSDTPWTDAMEAKYPIITHMEHP